MEKTKEELNALKKEFTDLTEKLQELTEEELLEVTGGSEGIKDFFKKIGEAMKSIVKPVI